MKRLAAPLLGLTAWAAQDDPVEAPMRVRDRVMAHAERVPNHTCTEAITRDWYEYEGGLAPKSCDALLGRRHRAGAGTLISLAATDRLRLEVALAATADESTVSFSARPETDPDSRPDAPPPIQLPAALAFTFEPTTPISADTAAAGDPFAGRPISAVRDQSGKTVAPAHALMEGTLVRVEIRHSSPPARCWCFS
jgi:hypothetical protein